MTTKTKTSKSSRTARHPTTAAGLFRLLNAFFNDHHVKDDDRRAAWDVLSALRGPDDENLTLKQATTAIIRSKLIGRTACNKVGINVADDCEAHRDARLAASDAIRDDRKDAPSEHFIQHVWRAFVALDLPWSEVNRP